MNGLFILALVCYGFALLGAVAMLLEWVATRRLIHKVVDEFLSTLPLMDDGGE